MKAPEVCKLALEVLEYLAPMAISGAEKLTALRAAASVLEAIQNQEFLEQTMKAALNQAFFGKK